MHFLIHFDASIPLQEVADALASRGIHLRCDAAGRTVAGQVPKFLCRDDVPANVVPLKKKVKR